MILWQVKDVHAAVDEHSTTVFHRGLLLASCCVLLHPLERIGFLNSIWLEQIDLHAWPAARQRCKIDVGDKNTCKVLTIRISQTAATTVSRSSRLQPRAGEGERRKVFCIYLVSASWRVLSFKLRREQRTTVK
jgi:hypothetical protein